MQTKQSMMRFHTKVLFSIALMGILFMSATFWSKCSDADAGRHDAHILSENDPSGSTSNFHGRVAHAHLNQLEDILGGSDAAGGGGAGEPINYQEIECRINEEYKVNCRKEDDEVYVPFSFLGKYFEVYGKLVEHDGVEVFDWRHSYSRIYMPKTKYTAEGVLMSFEHYNVEIRDRVKCITGIEGVPISTQWGPQGYFYPIQIAQYGLSHYSKYLIDKSRTVAMVEDAEDHSADRWIVNGGSSSVHSVRDPQSGSHVIQFQSPEALSNTGVSLPVGIKTGLVLSLDLRFRTNGSITVAVETKGKKPQLYYIHYVCSKELLSARGNEIYYGIGDRTRWTSITRDLSVDFQKGLLYHTSKKKLAKQNLNRVVSISLRGQGMVDNVTLANNAHLAQFYYAANWLVLNQDEKGGWPIMVTRSLANGKLELPPGWYSAMAQGQAMSLLVRAFYRTSNSKYMDAAVRAMHIFDIPSSDGGVLAHFAGRYPWYEEYPTTPSCFVLNGFIYSLVGLYDLKMVAPSEHAQEASRLYDAGLQSLTAMLPLFDTGSGSIYDLRHFTLGSGVAPNLARWDYHATHINQLLMLSTIEDDPVFETTAQRWIGYMKGKRSPHN